MTDGWIATSTTNAPDARNGHTAVWTGSEMIVWGGVGAGYFNTGGRYNPSIDDWTATSYYQRPHWAVRSHCSLDRQPNDCLGRCQQQHYFQHRGQISSQHQHLDSHQHDQRARCPSGSTAVWTGSQMVIWGGYDGNSDLNTGGRYCAQPGFTPTPTPTATPTPSEPSVTPSPTPTTTGTPTPAPRVTPAPRPPPTPPPRP